MNPLDEKRLISLDIETTGLDPMHDRITEIAALRLVDGEVVEKFVTLVDPKIPIPYAISRLTNITDEMVAGAPSEKEALLKLHDFVEGSAILGHNIDFDIGFIASRSDELDVPLWSGKRIDTLTASLMLYPRALSRTLSSLAGLFKIDIEHAHRAEDDAATTFLVAMKLWQKLLSLDDRTARMLAMLATSSGDIGLTTWTSAAKPFVRGGKATPPEIDARFIADFENIVGNPSDPAQCKMDESDIIGFLGPDSPMKEKLSGFTVRDVQLKMAKLVLDSLQYDLFLLIEAGTGTGKSFAYLLPSIVFAAQKGEKVVVSTKTKNLQEQLFFKDIPTLRKVLPFDFRAVLLKGRGNYLCLNRLERVLADHTSLSYEDRAVLTRILVWSSETTSGDIAELSSFYIKKYPALWARLRSETVSCLGHRCPFRKKCFLNRVRSAVVDAQIVVVNHSLLLAEMDDSSVLGEYNHAVIDEAHDLEEVAADFFGAQITTWDITSPLDDLYRERLTNKGLLAALFECFERIGQPSDEFISLYERCTSKVVALRKNVETTFASLTNRLQRKYNWHESPYSLRKRFHPGEEVFDGMKNDIARLAADSKSLVDDLGLILASMPEDEDDKMFAIEHEVSGLAAKLAELADNLDFMAKPTDPDAVYWWESPQRRESIDCKICWAPLDIAERMFEVFHSHKKSLVFTSATMSVGDSFDFIAGRLGLNYLDPEHVVKSRLGSPYDFPAQLLAIFPDFLPEPNARDYLPKLSELISRVSTETRAGSLALFTSYNALRQVYSTTAPELEDEGILVLAQGISGGRSQLARQFAADHGSLLLGTQSFWQGVDFRGEALQILYLTKIPFAVPTDPYVSGQCERIQRHGGNPFSDYTVPQAVIKFRQGIGRLIRGEEDVGVLLICDRRIGTRAYGRVFAESLPVSIERVDSIGEILTKIHRFI